MSSRFSWATKVGAFSTFLYYDLRFNPKVENMREIEHSNNLNFAFEEL